MSNGEAPALPPEPSAEPQPAAAPGRRGPGLGHVVLGAVLVLIGVGWLLEVLDVADVPWRLLLPAALIIVGLALTLGARTGRHGGLIATGVVLTLAVLLAGAIEILADIPLAGGIGDKVHRPTAAVENEYRWGLGSMTVDLGDTDLGAGRAIRASVAIGELILIVPAGLPVEVHARSGIGEVVVFGRSSRGLGPDLEYRSPEAGDQAVRLDLDVAIGKVEVRR